jgi:hypothetical protein
MPRFGSRTDAKNGPDSSPLRFQRRDSQTDDYANDCIAHTHKLNLSQFRLNPSALTRDKLFGADAHSHNRDRRSNLLDRSIGNLTMKRPASFALAVSLFAGLSLVTEARSQTLIVSGKTGKCLDVPDGSKATHAIIQQSQCGGGLSQRWFFRNGTIVNQNSGLCLDIPGGYESDHTPLQQYPCHGGPNQLWTVGANGEIKSVATLKCLDIPDGLSDDHLFVQQFQCSGGPNQAWSIRSTTFNTPAPSPSSSGSTVEFGTDRYGNDYSIFNVPPDNYDACRTACEADAHCQAWSYESSNSQRSNGVCWLKNPAPSAVPKQITTSGVILVRTGQSQPASGTDALARGDEAFQAQEYMESFRWYIHAANQGSAQAEQNLGFLYYNGFGVQQDYSQAALWYRKAADQGLPVGESSIGWMYQKGLGVPRNYAEALRWNRKAAEQGDMNGEQNLGRLYLFGFGVPKDPVEARRLLNLAAAQGSSEAKAILEGRGQ